MALPNPSDGDTVLATHVSEIKNHLEGGSAKTAPYHLKQSSGSFQVTLADAAGATFFRINDSAGVDIFHIDSDGNVTVVGTITLGGSVVLPTSASPSQTTEGQIVWDSDDDLPTFGTGAAAKYIGLSRGAGQAATATRELAYDTTTGTFQVWTGSVSKIVGDFIRVGGDTTERTTTSTTTVDLSTITTNIPATTPFVVRGRYRKTSGAAQAVQIGLKLNATQVIANVAVTSTTDRAEDGQFEFYVSPRLANYLFSAAYMRAFSGETGVTTITTDVERRGTAAIPTDPITSVIITGLSVSASNTLAIDEIHVYTLGVG